MIHNVRRAGFVSVRLPEFTRTTTFRWTLAVASVFVLYVMLLFVVIYWRTGSYLIARSDAVVTLQAQVFGAATTQDRLTAIDQLLRQDPRRVQHAGLFTAEGNSDRRHLERVPPGLAIDGPAQSSLVPVGPAALSSSSSVPLRVDCPTATCW